MPDPGPLKSQELPLPLLVPGFIMEDPLEPGVTWPSSRNLKMGFRMSFSLVFPIQVHSYFGNTLPCEGPLDSVMEPVRVMTRRERHGITSGAVL